MRARAEAGDGAVTRHRFVIEVECEAPEDPTLNDTIRAIVNQLHIALAPEMDRRDAQVKVTLHDRGQLGGSAVAGNPEYEQ